MRVNKSFFFFFNLKLSGKVPLIQQLSFIIYYVILLILFLLFFIFKAGPLFILFVELFPFRKFHVLEIFFCLLGGQVVGVKKINKLTDLDSSVNDL